MKIKSMSRTDPNKRGGALYEASRNLTEYNQQLRSRGASGNIPASTSPTVSVPKAGTAPAGTRIQSDYEAAQRANARRNYEYRQTTGQLPSQSGENQELSHRRDVVRDRQANYLQNGGTIGSAQNQVFQRSIDAIDAEIARRQNDRQKEARTRAKNTADALKYNQKTFEKRAKEAKKQYGEDSDEYRAAQQRADEATKAVWEAGLPWQMRVANYADAVGGRLVGTAPQLAATLTRPPENEIRDNEFSRRYQAMNNWLQSAADYFYDVSAQGNAALKYGLGKVGSTVADVAVAGGEMLSDAAMNMILPGSGMVARGLRAGASGANEAYHAGATPGQEFMYGAATAAVEMLTEKMFDGMAKVYGAGAADEITEGIVRRLAETNGGRTLARMLINTPGEGIEEVVSDLANPFIKYIYDNGAALQESYGTGEGFKSMMQEAGYDFLIGALLGVGGAAASVTNGEAAAKNARLALQDDFVAQMSTGDGSSFFIEPHSGQTTRFGVEQYGDTWWGYAIDGQGKTYWQNGYKSRSAAERGTAVAASDWIVEQAANPENRANDADVRARDEQRAETAAENPGSTIADDQAVEIQRTLQDSGAKNSSLAQAVKLSGIVDKILNGDTSLSNREILSLDLYHNGGLLDIVEQKTGEKIDTSSNKKILAGIRSIIEQRAERFEAEDAQKTAQAAAATTQSETQILSQIEQEAATDVQEAVLADEAQEPAVQTEMPVVDSITKDNPVVDVREAAPSENVDANLIGYSRDAKGEWSAERIKGGDEKEKAKSLSEIVEQIRHDFGVNITTGHIRGKRGQYDRSTSGIRSKLVNDLPNIAHELGHHLDNLFDLRGNLSAIMRDELENGLDDAARKSYPKEKWVSEGIAEYFRKYLQNRETAAIDYPEFTAYIKNLLPARDAAQLDQLADEVNAYYSLDADTATSSVRLREEGRPDARTLGEKIRDKADVLYQAWTDSNHGIKLFDEETGADTYKLATNAAYSDAIAGQVIIGDLTDANGKYISGGLTAALHGINLKDKEAYRLFGEYLIVRHGPERFAEGMRIFADDRKNSKEFMDRRAMELEQQHPEFKEAADRLYQFQRDCRQAWLVDTGLISADTAEQWDKRWQYYVPLNRAVSMKSRGIGAKRGFANQKSPIKKARGSGLDIIHPVDNIINNIVLMVNAGVRNNVMRKITDEAERLGADASLLEHVPTPMKREQFRAADLKEALKDTVDNSEMTAEDKMFMLDTIGNISDVLEQFSRGKAYGDVITVMKEGKPEFWKVNDPLLLESITSMSPARQAGVLDVFARVSRFMTANITGRNLVWNIFSNLPRDIMTFAAYSKEKNPWRGLTSVASAWGDRFKKPDKQSALYKEFLALGGGRVSAYTSDKNIAESARKHIARGGRVEWWNPLEIIDFVADTVENGPRFATYKMMRENGLTEQEAFYEAMDITVNFRRGGRLSRDVNKIVPFFNAGVQGLDKFRRWISAADAPSSYREKTIVKRVGMYITASIIAAAIEYAINHRNDDDEMYYHQLSAYTKHSYWCIPMGDGKFFCIPKPRELGVPASFFADVLNRAVDGDPYAFNAFYEYAANALLPSVASDVAQLDLYGAIGNLGLIGVVAYMAANRDFLGRPIESTAMRNLLPEDRFTEKTAITSKWLGRAFSKIPGAPDALKSPAMWDYFLSNTLGGFQKANKALFPVGSENRDWSLGVKNTWVKDARYSTDLVNWMYDRAEASSQEKRSNPDDPAIAVRAKMDDNLKSFYSSYYALAKNEKETEESTSARQTVLNVISEYRLAADYESPSGAEEVVRGVAERLDDTSLLPGVMNTYVKNRKGEKITLNAPDYVKYQMDYLRIYWEGVERLANRNMSDSRLAESIQKAKTTAKNVATENALSRIGEKSSI